MFDWWEKFLFFSLCSCWCQTKHFWKNVVSHLIYNVTNNLKIKNLKKFRTIFFTSLTWAEFQSSFCTHHSVIQQSSKEFPVSRQSRAIQSNCQISMWENQRANKFHFLIIWFSKSHHFKWFQMKIPGFLNRLGGAYIQNWDSEERWKVKGGMNHHEWSLFQVCSNIKLKFYVVMNICHRIHLIHPINFTWLRVGSWWFNVQ